MMGGMPSERAHLAVFREHEVSVDVAAALSGASLARPLVADAELGVFALSGQGTVLGAFQRLDELAPRSESDGVDAVTESAPSLVAFRRASGGPAIAASDGLVWVQLALSRPGALVPCSAAQVVNRYVRPLLRALTRLGATSSYFGRDWISTGHRPTAWVGFAHERSTGRSLFEAFVPVRSPWRSGTHASFDGKAPWTLEEALGKHVHVAHVCDVVASSYRDAYDAGAASVDLPAVTAALEDFDPSPWQARRDEAIGPIYAGRDREGRMRVGGEPMVARDAMESFTRALDALEASERTPSSDDLGRLVDEHFAPADAALFGVRSLTSIRDVLEEAFARSRATT